ncbi:hypothetical protein CIN_10940 [Commensalibacter intestini A911]|uniref:RNA-binding S4 domain-containing protein n=2 Tax=Commensalibacter intestini TaxID=479936 RepID=G6F0U1_9PROT|nr:hypothetical protein CIN_10940 [Commensalibacter intestini A911]
MWHARIYKTRSISTRFTKLGYIRVNSCSITKSAQTIKVNDVLTFPWNEQIRVIKILNLTKQRMGAKNISLIYQEILENSEAK